MKSTVEISASALRANFAAVQKTAQFRSAEFNVSLGANGQSALGRDTEVLAVIKADAYGHGARLCAPILRDAGAAWLGVTDAEEGIAVRAALDEDADGGLTRGSTRLLVMCGSLAEDAQALLAYDLTPVIWSGEHIDALEAAAKKFGQRCRVHVEIDTGMARQGIAPADVHAILARIAASPWLVCEGMLGHLCSAEATQAPSTREAERMLLGATAGQRAPHVFPEFVHLENTSALDEGSVGRVLDSHATHSASQRMVRTGLALYGYTLPLEGEPEMPPRLHDAVRPVMTWKAPVIGLRDVPAGATVGYGATFQAPHAMRLALLPVGYADGFRREASSSVGDGWVMIAGRRAAVVGRVSMNLTVVDVTGFDGPASEALRVGAAAVLLGEGVTAEDHARWAQTIPYDILCGIRGHRVVTA